MKVTNTDHTAINGNHRKYRMNLTQLSQVKEGKKEVMMGSYDGEL